MKLSVIIVNYNVKHFLEQCLNSVFNSSKKIEVEVFVVDNHSVDGSCQMVKEKFQNVYLIENKENLGFSKANNQAIKIAKSEYVLLLNPDTVVEESTFEKIIEFMDSNAQAGGLGVKMIDGKGSFLPESKRGLPTPSVAFYKIFGISKIFPKSKTFNRYHLGFLNKEKIHEIEILSGAFMLLRKKALDKIGLLDETFFMYGEDIDISYRLILGGYKNYYFPETTIIHYKGESTKKGSINYVRMFYNAMAIFAHKHFSKGNANFFTFFITIAIWIRALFAIITRFIKNISTPLIDGIIIYSAFYFITKYWEQYKYNGDGSYPIIFLNFVVPFYALLWVFSIFYLGGYLRPVKIKNVFKGIGLGTILILVFYALLSETMRFSRAILLIGTLLTFVLVPFFRFVLHFTKIKLFTLNKYRKKRIAIVGELDECNRVKQLLNIAKLQFDIIGFVSVNGNNNELFIGKTNELSEIVQIHKIDEIVFCSKDISSANVIKNMIALSAININYKIAGPESIAIIGSNSIDTAGDLYEIHLNSIAADINRRNKRLIDVILSIFLFAFFPIFVIIIKKPLQLIKNIALVMFGYRTWVGYSNSNNNLLPKLKQGIISPQISIIENNNSMQIDLMYAKDYKVSIDIICFFNKFKQLGNNKLK
ncbi:MAG: glycosyl transferase family 2 [Bacteroidetes bacterium CG02_land_8_20_14_3_00_31_25]|nr:glycosyltransferase [Bacteroidota bacterium]PIV58318.1 MAG: glycosyl transferase family 2 [Bacteroidetes bacterium CG02_land_8_20_14_3_00_31_25]PIX35565.1 MAG: glycosyl transferase family 2 [Bacteroidetes bacterium CG_4_8_14_3_um_filter_31_14]PIY03125.1 MAG: glycosyl transferase family 2 [Bacteroidetes bacterium CG_4_10_14_3_um_filter_31_20]